MADPFQTLNNLANEIDGAGSPGPIAKAIRVIANILSGYRVPINASFTLNLANCHLYWGRTLTFSGAYTITFSDDLPLNFSVAGVPPASGNASLASINNGGFPTLNGATTTITKSATDLVFAVLLTDKNTIVVK